MRSIIRCGLPFCLSLLSLPMATWAEDPVPTERLVYIGTYAAAEEEGIHVYRLNLATGAMTRVGGASGILNPSFQVLHPNRKFLYTVSETMHFEGGQAGSISAFAIDPRTGLLTLLNTQSTMGAHPCHVTVDGAAQHVLAANYSGGSVVVLPIRGDGGLEMPCAFVQHQGSSVHPRQQGPHAHCINVDAQGGFVVSADLGLDQVLIYRYDSDRGSLTPNRRMPAARVTPGAGPRHFAFHPDGKHGYVINELNSTVTAFDYDAQRGTLTSIQDISTLPDGFDGDNTTAEIAVAPNGQFVYGSNRGHNSLVVYSVDPVTGKLSYVSHHPTQGQAPRNFGIDPAGNWLLAANQDSNNVIIFRIDSETGKLTPTGTVDEISRPVCITFLDLP